MFLLQHIPYGIVAATSLAERCSEEFRCGVALEVMFYSIKATGYLTIADLCSIFKSLKV
jgi:hypothetical protein